MPCVGSMRATMLGNNVTIAELAVNLAALIVVALKDGLVRWATAGISQLVAEFSSENIHSRTGFDCQPTACLRF